MEHAIGSKNNRSLKTFFLTGREMFVEMRSSMHTARGKGGLFILLLVFLFIYFMHDEDQINVLLIAVWTEMGMGMMMNLQNHKLAYLLPVSRKEFAAVQICKMIWSMLLIVVVLMVYNILFWPGNVNFWIYTLLKIIPVSITIASYQIASVNPVKGSNITGAQIFHLSWGIIIVNIVIAFFNAVIEVEQVGMINIILSVLNYIFGIYTAVHFYGRIAHSDLYYDEL